MTQTSEKTKGYEDGSNRYTRSILLGNSAELSKQEQENYKAEVRQWEAERAGSLQRQANRSNKDHITLLNEPTDEDDILSLS